MKGGVLLDKELYFEFQLELRKPFLESKLVLQMIDQLLRDDSNIASLILEKNKISIKLYRGSRTFASVSCTAALRGVSEDDRKNISYFNIAANKDAPIEIVYLENCRKKENPHQEFGPIWVFKVYKHPDDKVQQGIERTINSIHFQSQI